MVWALRWGNPTRVHVSIHRASVGHSVDCSRRLPSCVVMRTPIALFAVVMSLLAGCPAPSELCGVSTSLPSLDEAPSGRAKGTKNGAAFEESGTWAPAPSRSIVIGLLTLSTRVDDTGSDIDGLIEAGAFPICALQREASETVNVASEGAFLTSAAAGGGLAILGKEGNELIGRFSLELQNNGGDELSYSAAFRLPQR